LHLTLEQKQELAMIQGVGQSHSLMGMNESHVKDSFHSWLIKAGEGFPGIRWLHLSCCHNSDKAENSVINST